MDQRLMEDLTTTTTDATERRNGPNNRSSFGSTITTLAAAAAADNDDNNDMNDSSTQAAITTANSICTMLNNVISTAAARNASSSSSLSLTSSGTTTWSLSPAPTSTGTTSTRSSSCYSTINDDYQRRLKTFTTMEYFAKPIHLSPIICAITGWELQASSCKSTTGVNNNDRILFGLPMMTSRTTKSVQQQSISSSSSLLDTVPRLFCKCCGGKIVIYIPSNYNTNRTTKNTDQTNHTNDTNNRVSTQNTTISLIIQYQHQLYQQHGTTCPHRTTAQYFIRDVLCRRNYKYNNSSNDGLNDPTLLPITSTTETSYTLVVPTILSRAIMTMIQQQQQIIDDTTTTTTALTFKSSALDFVEQRNPWYICDEKFRQLYPLICKKLQQQRNMSTKVTILPELVQHYDSGCTNTKRNDRNETDHASQSSLLSRLVQLFQQRRNYIHKRNSHVDVQQQHAVTIVTPVEQQASELVMALIIMGWELQKQQNHQQQRDTYRIQCVFCLAQHHLITDVEKTVVDVQDDTETGNAIKNIIRTGDSNSQSLQQTQQQSQKQPHTTPSSSSSQWNRPYTAHRYYCPWVCGFPLSEQVRDDNNNNTTVVQCLLSSSIPLWQIVTDRLLHEQDIDQNGDGTTTAISVQHDLHNIYQQLRHSISPQFQRQQKRKLND